MDTLYRLQEIKRDPQSVPARTLADVPVRGTCFLRDMKIRNTGGLHGKNIVVHIIDGDKLFSYNPMIPVTDIRNPDGTPLAPPATPATPKPWTLGECDPGDRVIFNENLWIVGNRDEDHTQVFPDTKGYWSYQDNTEIVTARYRLVPVDEPPREVLPGIGTYQAQSEISQLKSRIRELEDVPFRFEPREPVVKKFGDIETWDFGYRYQFRVFSGSRGGGKRYIMFADGSGSNHDADTFSKMTVVGRLVWNEDYKPPQLNDK